MEQAVRKPLPSQPNLKNVESGGGPLQLQLMPMVMSLCIHKRDRGGRE
jgi:hypothetical protein